MMMYFVLVLLKQVKNVKENTKKIPNIVFNIKIAIIEILKIANYANYNNIYKYY